MTSWRAKFRRNRTSEPQDTKTSSSLALSKHFEDTETHRKPRSRFLRRSKHEDEGRPQSMFIENTSVLRDSSSKYDHPNVQEILDKNRHLRRSNSKSPKSWKRLITGGEKPERSPAIGRKTEHKNNEYDSYSHKENDYNSNSYRSSTAVYETKDKITRDTEPFRVSSEDKSSNRNFVSGSKVNNNDDLNENSPGRRISHIRRQKSLQNDGKHGDDVDKKVIRSKTGSPYDNVVEANDVPKRERRPRSLYFEETNEKPEAEKTDTPRRERRQRVNRGESTDSSDSQRTKDNKEIKKKDSFVLRKPRAKYPVDDDDTFAKLDKKKKDVEIPVSSTLSSSSSSYKQNDNSKTTSKSTSVGSLRSNVSSDQIDRNFGKGGYDSRSKNNILGATMDYLESRTQSDYKSNLPTRSTVDFESETDSFLQRRRRYQGLLGNRQDSTSTSQKYENPLYKSIDKPDYERRNSYYLANKHSVDKEPRRDSTTKFRPKSLYNYGESLDFTDSLSKFQSIDASTSKPRESYSVWDRYKNKTTGDNKQANSSIKATVLYEDVQPKQRPMSLFLADESKADKSTYRGNWSAAVPKKPAHLRDFSVPQDKSASRVSYRRRESQQQQQQIEKQKIDEPLQQQQLQLQQQKKDVESTEEKVQDTPSFEITVDSPKEENEIFQKENKENQTKFHLAPPEIEVEDADSKNTKAHDDSSEEVVVRRRRKDHAAPARPSSFYFTKTESVEDSMKDSKKYSDIDNDDDDSEGTKTRRNLLDSEDIKTGLRRKSAVERRIKSKRVVDRPKSVLLADVSRVNIHDPLHESVDEVKRQFERLLRRTEDWKRRTESLDSKATILTSSYRNLRKTINEIQGGSDDVYAVFDDIGSRLVENDTVGFPDTEEEWRRAQEGNRLIEKALKILLEQQRNPKPEFYYSESESEPESPVENFHDMPSGSSWSSPGSEASRNRPRSDYYCLRSSGSSSENLSYSKPTRGDYFTNEYSVATTTRLSPLLSDSYSWRKRIQESSYDYKRYSGLRNSYGRYIPETAV